MQVPVVISSDSIVMVVNRWSHTGCSRWSCVIRQTSASGARSRTATWTGGGGV
jgi:hypothetical protein